MLTLWPQVLASSSLIDPFIPLRIVHPLKSPGRAWWRWLRGPGRRRSIPGLAHGRASRRRGRCHGDEAAGRNTACGLDWIGYQPEFTNKPGLSTQGQEADTHELAGTSKKDGEQAIRAPGSPALLSGTSYRAQTSRAAKLYAVSPPSPCRRGDPSSSLVLVLLPCLRPGFPCTGNSANRLHDPGQRPQWAEAASHPRAHSGGGTDRQTDRRYVAP